jgi:hypothetical protein
MGVNCMLYLPTNVKIDTVSEVMAILSGAKIETNKLDGSRNPDEKYVSVAGIKFRVNESSPESVDIVLEFPLTEAAREARLNDGTPFAHYYFEGDDRNNSRMLYPASTPYWCAICKGLVDFFGGKVIYDDSKSFTTKRNVYRRKAKADKMNRPTDGKPFWDLHKRLRELKPLTKRDFKAVWKKAAYQKMTLHRRA